MDRIFKKRLPYAPTYAFGPLGENWLSYAALSIYSYGKAQYKCMQHFTFYY